MLQAPSHLSRVCGHSHIKKFWLMQMQNESQACENKSGLLASSTLPVSSSSAKSPDNKQSPQRSSGSPCMRSLLAGASSNGRSVRPLLGGAIIPASYGGVAATSRHTSIVTCAESLSPPARSDQTYRYNRSSSPDFSASKMKEENDERDAEELVCGVSKTLGRERGFFLSTSRCGSPSEDAEVDLVDIAPRGAEQINSTIVGIPSLKVEAIASVNAQLPAQSTPPFGRDDFSSLLKAGSSAEDREYICCNVSTSSMEGEELSKDLDGSPIESNSFENENSDSGTDDGNFEYLRSPVRGARTIYSEKRARPLDGKSLCSPWILSTPPVFSGDSGKGSQTGELHRENLTGNLEAGTEDANMRNSVLRICSLCGTSKTPLWRSGPHGPKSLCNACGIRFKKSKRCPGQTEGCDHLASPLASPDVSKPPSRPLKRKQDTLLPCEFSSPRDSRSDVVASEAYQHQKRSRWPKLLIKGDIGGHRAEGTGSSAESCLTLSLQSPSSVSLSSRKVGLNTQTRSEFEKLATVEERRTVGRVIAKDEEEAAVLLMYLSCGLVYA